MEKSACPFLCVCFKKSLILSVLSNRESNSRREIRSVNSFIVRVVRFKAQSEALNWFHLTFCLFCSFVV